MLVESYLFFDGRCEEAVEFYRKTVGAEVVAMMRYKDSPQPHPPETVRPGYENKVMHVKFRIGETNVMAADDCKGSPVFQGFSLCLRVANEAEAQRAFLALAEGGQVKMPLTKMFFSPSFGMLTDRFGVGWMVIVGDNDA